VNSSALNVLSDTVLALPLAAGEARDCENRVRQHLRQHCMCGRNQSKQLEEYSGATQETFHHHRTKGTHRQDDAEQTNEEVIMRCS
jgi:hypothetical protein